MVRLTQLLGKPFGMTRSKTFTVNTIIDEPHKPKVKKEETDKFKCSTISENLNFAVGVLSSVAMGTLFPIILVAYGEFTTLLIARHTPNAIISPSFILSKFGGGETNAGQTFEQQMDALVNDSIAFFLAGSSMSAFQFVFGIIAVTCLNNAALAKVGRMRRYYLKAILKQEMSWHDKQTTGFASSFTENLNKIQEGTGEKVGIFIYLVITFVASVTVSMFYGWELTLVMTVICPIFVILTIVVARVQTKLTTKEAQSYGEAGSVVEEVLSSIRTVVAYGGEDKEVERYEQKMAPAHKIGVRSGVFVGLGGGITWMLIFWAYSLCFWYGTPLIIGDRHKEDKVYTPGVLLIILFGVVAGAMNLGFTVPYLEAFSKARGSSKVVSSLLRRKPVIDVNAGGIRLQTKLDEIEFKNVHFSYPARPDIQVLKGVDFKVKKGESVALVGSSGSGKSTTVQLIERFYDPTNGTVNLNGIDLKKLDLKWVRSQIGLVGQEPVLFNTTIAENICCDLNVSREEMETAAKEANAHNFIMKLPNGYDTNVGERGTQLSGGQKQRVAIARALIRKPGILLLDEATSALDVANEAIVQQALDKASKGRTTLIISHRLSSIRNVDRIIVMSGGQIIEQGTHAELMELKNHYYELVSADASLQQLSKDGTVNQEVNIESIDLISSPNKVMTDSDSDSKNSVIIYNEIKASWWKILSLNKPDLLYVIVGSLSSFFMGCMSPVSAVFFGEMYGILSSPDPNEVYATTNGYAIAFIIVGIVAAISIFLQVLNLTIAGVRLVSRLRVKVFSAMLRQEMAWFDDEKHSVGALSAKLSGDTSAVQGATGSRLGTLLQGFSTLGVGAVMSVFYSWEMTIICLLCVPLILVSLIIEGKIMNKEGVAEKEALETATKIAVEAVMSVRTVASLGQENAIVERYNKVLVEAERAVRYKLRYRGAVFAFGQTCINFSYSVSLCFGGYLIAKHNVPYKNIIIVSEALLFGAWILGHALSFVPNINLARIAAGHLFQILDRNPRIYSVKPSSSCLPSSNKSEGNIDYKDVHFAYPTRPDVNILNGLKLSIAQGQTVALVGSSGSGKSTCIQLLQRFYDPVSGSVAVGSKDISSIPISYLRSELGLVSQEPVLFDRTIGENIAYGDNSREVPMTEIIDAAKRANIHNFVSSLPAGYETRLGTQGTQLSGGQKQRIAIARALVRNPRILILDEATSALDTQSEKIVQEALDDAMKGRTCIIIAHRLSTITHADVICVLNQGVVAEMGSHEQLVAKGGLYTQLLQQHSL